MKKLIAAFGMGALLCWAPVSIAESVQLTWTATGDDGLKGQATRYEIRYSLFPITPLNFSAATLVQVLPVPKMAGSPESLTVEGLAPSTPYYFGIVAIDDVGNRSALSNIVKKVTPGAIDHGLKAGPLGAFPSPFDSTISFGLISEGLPSQVKIMDLSGREIWSSLPSPPRDGYQVIIWDGKDNLGRQVPSGLYFAMIQAGGHIQILKITYLK